MYESACRELRHGKVERIFFLVGRRASTVAAYHAGAHPASGCRRLPLERRALGRKCSRRRLKKAAETRDRRAHAACSTACRLFW